MISRVKGVEKISTNLSLTKHDSRRDNNQNQKNKDRDFEKLLSDEMNKKEDEGMKKVLRP